MGIIICRVDDRLIHGQVATSWIRGFDINVVVVVDDEIANNEMQVSILKMSAPANVKVYALSSDKFVEKYNKGILDNYNVMLIFENIFTPLKLINSGIKITSLNLGGIRFKEGRKQLSKSISLNDNEIKVIKEILSLGVEVEHRQLSSDSKVNVSDIIGG